MQPTKLLFAKHEAPKLFHSYDEWAAFCWHKDRYPMPIPPGIRVEAGALSFYRRYTGNDLPDAVMPAREGDEEQLDLLFAGLTFGPNRPLVSKQGIKVYLAHRANGEAVSTSIAAVYESEKGAWIARAYEPCNPKQLNQGLMQLSAFQVRWRVMALIQVHKLNEALAAKALTRQDVDISRVFPASVRPRLGELAGLPVDSDRQPIITPESAIRKGIYIGGVLVLLGGAALVGWGLSR